MYIPRIKKDRGISLLSFIVSVLKHKLTLYLAISLIIISIHTYFSSFQGHNGHLWNSNPLLWNQQSWPLSPIQQTQPHCTWHILLLLKLLAPWLNPLLATVPQPAVPWIPGLLPAYSLAKGRTHAQRLPLIQSPGLSSVGVQSQTGAQAISNPKQEVININAGHNHGYNRII